MGKKFDLIGLRASDLAKLIDVSFKYPFEEDIEEQLKMKIVLDAAYYLTSISKCESPIEKLLFLELISYSRDMAADYASDCITLMVVSQHEIKIHNHAYRADILVTMEHIPKNKVINLVVECDGHNFHEKTKEQAARDKARDRNLQMAGYNIVRFTGSEIYKNVRQCVRDIFNVLDTHINRIGIWEENGVDVSILRR